MTLTASRPIVVVIIIFGIGVAVAIPVAAILFVFAETQIGANIDFILSRGAVIAAFAVVDPRPFEAQQTSTSSAIAIVIFVGTFFIAVIPKIDAVIAQAQATISAFIPSVRTADAIVKVDHSSVT